MARRSREERRRTVLDAARRLLAREGTQSTSVRRVADEAGMSAGSLRHIFPTHEELFVALLEDGRARAAQQLNTLRERPAHRDLSLDAAVDLLVSLLPVRAEARIDTIAQLAVHTDHPTDEKLDRQRRRTSEELDALCHAVVAATCPPEEVALAALELRLVLDGLSLRLLDDGSFGETEARFVLRRRLRELCFL